MEPHWHCHINFYNASVRRHPDHWMNTSSAVGMKCYQIFSPESMYFIKAEFQQRKIFLEVEAITSYYFFTLFVQNKI